GGFFKTRCQTNAGPAANTRQYANVLFAVVFPGGDVADHARRCFELPQLFAAGIDGLDIAFKRSVEHHIASCREGAAPYGESFRNAPQDFAFVCVPGDEVAHAAMTVRCREHGYGCANIGLAGYV